MRIRSLGEVARLARAGLVRGDASSEIRTAVIDSREATPGALFVALQGDHCHGIEHADAALKLGAAAVLCDPGYSDRHRGASIEAASAREALSTLAGAIREQEEHQIAAVAVTGSVGKTTTCAMIEAILGSSCKSHAPRASFNNDLGVPITILDAAPDTEVLVLELGTSSPGEIAARAEMARPSHGVITAISEAHLSGLGDLEGVRKEKFSMLNFIDGDERWAPVEWRSSIGEAASCYRWTGPAGDLEVRREGPDSVLVIDRLRTREFSLQFDPGPDWLLRCFESALAMGLDFVEDPGQLQEAVSKISLPPLRHEIHCVCGIQLVLDCYNSSPRALKSEIDWLSRSNSSRQVAVVGTMEELGENEQQFHIDAGRHLASAGIDLVFVCGRGAGWLAEGASTGDARVIHIENNEQGVQQIIGQLQEGDTVLFKASRSEGLDLLASHLETRLIEERGQS